MALIDQVATTGQPVDITRAGKVIARVVPAEDARIAGLRRSLQRSVLFERDVIRPIGDRWDVED